MSAVKLPSGADNKTCSSCDAGLVMVCKTQGSHWSGKTEKSRGICVVTEKYYFWKVRENDLGSCRLQICVIFLCLQVSKSRQICGFH